MKYFKISILNQTNKVLYKEGYREDKLPYNPPGSNIPRGIQFASKDIFAFCHLGTLVYEVEPIGEIQEIPEKYKSYIAAAGNIRSIGNLLDIKTVAYLIDNGADVNIRNDWFFQEVIERGDFKLAEYLIKKGVDIHAGNDYALRSAASNGHLEVVKFLVENGADIHAWNDYALRIAKHHECLGVVEYLKSKMDII